MTAKTAKPQNPLTVALRYRAYCHVQTYGANMTVLELAEALDVPAPRLQRAMRDEQWASALRAHRLDVPVSAEFQGADAFAAQQEARASIGAAA